MKLYLAARYTRKDEIRGYAYYLTTEGFYTITSTWFLEPHDPAVTLAEVTPANLQEYAHRDLAEIDAADALLLFSESDQTWNKRGGRHVEYGYALAKGKRIFVVGPHENIFHYVQGVTHFDTLDDFVKKGRG